MAELYIKVKDTKLSFLLNLLKKFDFVEVDQRSTEIYLTDEQQKELNKRYEEVINGEAHLISKKEFDANKHLGKISWSEDALDYQKNQRNYQD